MPKANAARHSLTAAVLALAVTAAMALSGCAPATDMAHTINWRPAVMDSDADGVPDYADKCPDTKPGTPVDEFGCPTATTKCDQDFADPGSPLYNCASRMASRLTPGASAVPANMGGETVDVVKFKTEPILEPAAAPPASPQRVPEAQAKAMLDRKPATSTSIAFAQGSAAIAPGQDKAISGVAAYLKNSPGSKALIYGYAPAGTFSSGSDLTSRRIEAVAANLADVHGIERSRLMSAILPENKSAKKKSKESYIRVIVPQNGNGLTQASAPIPKTTAQPSDTPIPDLQPQPPGGNGGVPPLKLD